MDMPWNSMWVMRTFSFLITASDVVLGLVRVAHRLTCARE
jgi:hypothetical protein